MQKMTSEIETAKKSEVLATKGIGTIETDKCLLNKVLYVTNLNKNLLSVNAITEMEEK